MVFALNGVGAAAVRADRDISPTLRFKIAAGGLFVRDRFKELEETDGFRLRHGFLLGYGRILAKWRKLVNNNLASYVYTSRANARAYHARRG